MGDPIIKKRLPWDRLIFITEIPVVLKCRIYIYIYILIYIYIEMAPSLLTKHQISTKDTRAQTMFTLPPSRWRHLVYECCNVQLSSQLGHWLLLIISVIAWWCHQMDMFSALLALYVGNSPVTVNSPHKGQWRGALRFSLICACTNDRVNNRKAGDLRHHCAHYDGSVMF